MIAISMLPKGCEWSMMSFASTLYLRPILDLLLANVPPQWEPEIRLGLQEALVNAAKHGNKLDPSKTVVVHFSVSDGEYSWVICDQGAGFTATVYDYDNKELSLPPEEAESGRGLCLLHQIFDQVRWNHQGTQLRLCKQVSPAKTNRKPLLC
ncbi:MAG: anti-sigma regulatory factor [Chloroflexaceae bacterium]|nr:anti-sigma regulatory factor [Chloroflexaceae bacterium]